jgi:hypothetical protein
MASLYRRATPSQARILRAVEGAVRNTQHAHPELSISPRHRRGIAKRAAGTLTAQWPDVLAAKRIRLPSESHDEFVTWDNNRRGQPSVTGATGRDAGELYGRVPLRLLIKSISCQIKPLKLAGQTERAEALIDVMKLIYTLRGGVLSSAKQTASDKSRDEQ